MRSTRSGKSSSGTSSSSGISGSSSSSSSSSGSSSSASSSSSSSEDEAPQPTKQPKKVKGKPEEVIPPPSRLKTKAQMRKPPPSRAKEKENAVPKGARASAPVGRKKKKTTPSSSPAGKRMLLKNEYGGATYKTPITSPRIEAVAAIRSETGSSVVAPPKHSNVPLSSSELQRGSHEGSGDTRPALSLVVPQRQAARKAAENISDQTRSTGLLSELFGEKESPVPAAAGVPLKTSGTTNATPGGTGRGRGRPPGSTKKRGRPPNFKKSIFSCSDDSDLDDVPISKRSGLSKDEEFNKLVGTVKPTPSTATTKTPSHRKRRSSSSSSSSSGEGSSSSSSSSGSSSSSSSSSGDSSSSSGASSSSSGDESDAEDGKSTVAKKTKKKKKPSESEKPKERKKSGTAKLIEEALLLEEAIPEELEIEPEEPKKPPPPPVIPEPPPPVAAQTIQPPTTATVLSPIGVRSTAAPLSMPSIPASPFADNKGPDFAQIAATFAQPPPVPPTPVARAPPRPPPGNDGDTLSLVEKLKMQYASKTPATPSTEEKEETIPSPEPSDFQLPPAVPPVQPLTVNTSLSTAVKSSNLSPRTDAVLGIVEQLQDSYGKGKTGAEDWVGAGRVKAPLSQPTGAHVEAHLRRLIEDDIAKESVSRGAPPPVPVVAPVPPAQALSLPPQIPAQEKKSSPLVSPTLPRPVATPEIDLTRANELAEMVLRAEQEEASRRKPELTRTASIPNEKQPLASIKSPPPPPSPSYARAPPTPSRGRGRPRGSRGGGRGRGRGRGRGAAALRIPKALQGTVYEFDDEDEFSEPVAPAPSLNDYKPLRDKKQSTSVSTPSWNQPAEQDLSPLTPFSPGFVDSFSPTPSECEPETAPPPPPPPPTKSATKKSPKKSQQSAALPPVPDTNSVFDLPEDLPPPAGRPPPSPRSKLPSSSPRRSVSSSPKVSSSPSTKRLPSPSAITSPEAGNGEESPRSQLKMKIKGPFRDPSYLSNSTNTSVPSAPPSAPVVDSKPASPQALAPMLPPPAALSSNTPSLTTPRGMRKKELIRAYCAEEPLPLSGMPISNYPPASLPPAPQPSSLNPSLTRPISHHVAPKIPKAMASINTKAEFKNVVAGSTPLHRRGLAGKGKKSSAAVPSANLRGSDGKAGQIAGDVGSSFTTFDRAQPFGRPLKKRIGDTHLIEDGTGITDILRQENIKAANEIREKFDNNENHVTTEGEVVESIVTLPSVTRRGGSRRGRGRGRRRGRGAYGAVGRRPATSTSNSTQDVASEGENPPKLEKEISRVLPPEPETQTRPSPPPPLLPSDSPTMPLLEAEPEPITRSVPAAPRLIIKLGGNVMADSSISPSPPPTPVSRGRRKKRDSPPQTGKLEPIKIRFSKNKEGFVLQSKMNTTPVENVPVR